MVQRTLSLAGLVCAMVAVLTLGTETPPKKTPPWNERMMSKLNDVRAIALVNVNLTRNITDAVSLDTKNGRIKQQNECLKWSKPETETDCICRGNINYSITFQKLGGLKTLSLEKYIEVDINRPACVGNVSVDFGALSMHFPESTWQTSVKGTGNCKINEEVHGAVGFKHKLVGLNASMKFIGVKDIWGYCTNYTVMSTDVTAPELDIKEVKNKEITMNKNNNAYHVRGLSAGMYEYLVQGIVPYIVANGLDEMIKNDVAPIIVQQFNTMTTVLRKEDEAAIMAKSSMSLVEMNVESDGTAVKPSSIMDASSVTDDKQDDLSPVENHRSEKS